MVTINLTDTTYEQGFNDLSVFGLTGSALPTGWSSLETGSSGNTTYSISNGSFSTGNTYLFGAGSGANNDPERALGGLRSATVIPTFGASFTNTTDSTITGFDISYVGELWRLGTPGREDRLDFQYSLDASSLDTGSWVDVDELDFTTPNTTGLSGARDGNAAENQANLNGLISSLEIAPGETFWIRWTDFAVPGANDGLAVDDFSLTPLFEVPLVSDIQITEFMYAGGVGEFIEFTNVGTAPVDMTGWSYSDSARLPGSFSLDGFGLVQPGESVILTQASEADFRTAWGLDSSFKVIGGLDLQTLQRNDEINLYDAEGNLSDRLSYGDQDFPGTIRPQDVSGWTTLDNLDATEINDGWQLSDIDDEQNSREGGGAIGSPGVFNAGQPGIVLIESAAQTEVEEGGTTDTYAIALRSQPSAEVVITINPDGQTSTDVTTLIFTPDNWNVPQTVIVTAIDDDLFEENHTSTITHTVTSDDDTYDGISVRPVTVDITDNDSPPPLVNGLPATIYINSRGLVVGPAYQMGELYSGELFSNSDGTGNPDDTIAGTDGDDSIWGGIEGSDIIDAGEGNNTIGFGNGDSWVRAGDGDDFAYATGNGGGDNIIDLGLGTNSFWAAGGNNTITARGRNTIGIGTGNDTVTIGAGDDFIYSVNGGGGTNVLRLGSGANEVWLEGGDYTIITGRDNDVIGLGTGTDNVNAGDGDNIIYMVNPELPAGNKTIQTGDGDDYIATGSGDDLLNGGTGNNILLGGVGADTFVVSSGAYNYIGDFELGVDQIQLIDLEFEQLNFAQGQGDTALDTFIAVDGVVLVQVANLEASQLGTSVNFV
ncbi:MAG TPA: lamin tail domain-containing protein [Candidatus Obscuribacterales bacterium]